MRRGKKIDVFLLLFAEVIKMDISKPIMICKRRAFIVCASVVSIGDAQEKSYLM